MGRNVAVASPPFHGLPPLRNPVRLPVRRLDPAFPNPPAKSAVSKTRKKTRSPPFVHKVLLFPLRLAVGWGLAPRLIGFVGVTMLVLLRLTVGMHFFSEGVDKFESKGSWSAAPFFSAARGPFESHFHSLVWDHDGQLRLDRDRMMVVWAKYRDRIEKHYGLDEQQAQTAQENYAKAVQQYDYILELNSNDIEEYRFGRDRVDALDVDPVRRDVASLAGQREEIRREWIAKVAPRAKAD